MYRGWEGKLGEEEENRRGKYFRSIVYSIEVVFMIQLTNIK